MLTIRWVIVCNPIVVFKQDSFRNAKIIQKGHAS